MKNTNTDLKNILFATLEGLLDRDEPLELDRAKVVADVAQTIVNATKSEIEFMRLKIEYAKSLAKSENHHLMNSINLNSPFLEPKEDYFEDKTLKLNPNMGKVDED